MTFSGFSSAVPDMVLRRRWTCGEREIEGEREEDVGEERSVVVP